MTINLNLKKSLFAPYAFKYIFDYSHRWEAWMGSAGSAKSYSITQKLIIRACTENIRILVCRRYGTTIRNTVFALFKEILKKWKLLEYVKINESDYRIIFPNGSEILFTGLDEETKLLSLTNISCIWVEEAYEVTKDIVDQLNLRMRGNQPNQQIILSWNPINKSHWLYEFVNNPPESWIFIHSTYRDNPFLNEDYVKSLEELYKRNPQKARVYCDGEWGVNTDGLVFKNWKIEELDDTELAKKYEHRAGMDFGFNDPSAIVESFYDKVNKTIYVTKCFYKTGQQLSDLARAINDMHLTKSKIFCDSAEPRTIDYFKRNNINAAPCIKGANSVNARLLFLQDHLIVIDKKCVEVINEFENFSYILDKKTNNYTDNTTHEYSHSVDALGYAYSDIYTKGTLKNIRQINLRIIVEDNMYILEKGKELSATILTKILNRFNTSDRPKLQKLLDYYNGKQDILTKVATDTGKPCNKVVVNYCNSIVKNYLGYIAGKRISYDNDDFDEVKDILNYNDVATEDVEWLRQALIYGRAFEVNYIDEFGKQRFRLFDTRECIPIYDNTLNNDLMYVVRYYSEDLLDEKNERYIVEVYDNVFVTKYRSNSGFSSFEQIEKYQHFFDQVPVTVFSLNHDETSIFNQVMNLQDSYNTLVSASIDDVESFADAYLVLKGCSADDEDLTRMKENRVLLLDADCSAEYLTKSISDTQVQNLLQNINDQIHKIANSPDFNDEKFMAQSGIAMRFKLTGLENIASSIEAQMRKALVKRIELISAILKLTNEELIWRDVKIEFTRNLPQDIQESVNIVNQLRGVVSQKTLLSLLPFVKDVDAEMERVKEEKEESMELYSFGVHDEDEDEELTNEE